MENQRSPRKIYAFQTTVKIKLKALPYKEEVTREDIAEVG
jgi:hypothetical protein